MSSTDREFLTNLLLRVENDIKDHHLFYQSTLETQRGIINRMWELAQRFTIIAKGVPSKCINPTAVSPHIENEIKAEFHNKLTILGDSNFKLSASVTIMKNSLSELQQSLLEMNSSQIQDFDDADAVQPPIGYFIEIFTDCVKYYTRLQNQLNCFATLLTTDSIANLERYKQILQPNTEFNEHFAKSTAHCNYLNNHKKSKT